MRLSLDPTDTAVSWLSGLLLILHGVESEAEEEEDCVEDIQRQTNGERENGRMEEAHVPLSFYYSTCNLRGLSPDRASN
ncbi:hypothetical protein K449DRAFT_464339 [Hypoxylon sp. EC38]|nr:hypothetical protein K449DRAFT_464339 [Hypoxylon sp. EC38]